jgi:hypothetical protein
MPDNNLVIDIKGKHKRRGIQNEAFEGSLLVSTHTRKDI